MKENITPRLNWFLQNIDLLLDDIEQEKAGNTIHLYFDTSHIVSAVLGIPDFYDHNGQFKRGAFEQPSTLVTSLASASWLGEIRLLPPHQAEFLVKLELDFGVGIERDPRGTAKRFLRDVGFPKLSDRLSLKYLTNEQIEDLVREQAGSAQKLFKAVRCIVPWHRRLYAMLHDDVLILEKDKIDYEPVFDNKWTMALNEALDKDRPGMTINNFADTIAITAIAEKVAAFSSGSKVLPLLFPSRELLNVVKAQKTAEAHLEYPSALNGQPINALRNWDYFIFRATFLPKPPGGDYAKVKKAKEQELHDLRENIALMLKAQRDITVEEINDVNAMGKPLGRLIRELQEFSFLENVWLPSQAPKDLGSAVQEIVRAAEEVKRSKRFKAHLDKELRSTKKVLTENVKDFEWVRSLWDELEDAAKDFRTRKRRLQTRNADIYRDLGLLKYAFPHETRRHTEDVLRQLLKGGNEIKEARGLIMSACLRGMKDPDGEVDDLALAAATLWSLEMNHHLIMLLDKIDPRLPHFSLKIMHAEMIFMLRPKARRGAHLLEELEEEYKESNNRRRRADMAVGLAFLYFRLWRYKGGRATWRFDPEGPPVAQPLAFIQKDVNLATHYAHDAYKNLTNKNQRKKKAYALNQYLYYMVEGGGDEMLDKMMHAAHSLSTYFTPSRELWQYRFDDTLARYYHRLASIAVRNNRESDWKRAIEQAHTHIKRALNESDDPTVLECSNLIGWEVNHDFEVVREDYQTKGILKESRGAVSRR